MPPLLISLRSVPVIKGETEAVGKLFEKTMMEKYGPAVLSDHFVIMDTICDATQAR